MGAIRQVERLTENRQVDMYSCILVWQSSLLQKRIAMITGTVRSKDFLTKVTSGMAPSTSTVGYMIYKDNESHPGDHP